MNFWASPVFLNICPSSFFISPSKCTLARWILEIARKVQNCFKRTLCIIGPVGPEIWPHSHYRECAPGTCHPQGGWPQTQGPEYRALMASPRPQLRAVPPRPRQRAANMLRPILALKAGSPEAASLSLPVISSDDRNLGHFYHLPSLFPLPQISREVQQLPQFLLDHPTVPLTAVPPGIFLHIQPSLSLWSWGESLLFIIRILSKVSHDPWVKWYIIYKNSGLHIITNHSTANLREVNARMCPRHPSCNAITPPATLHGLVASNATPPCPESWAQGLARSQQGFTGDERSAQHTTGAQWIHIESVNERCLLTTRMNTRMDAHKLGGQGLQQGPEKPKGERKYCVSYTGTKVSMCMHGWVPMLFTWNCHIIC